MSRARVVCPVSRAQQQVGTFADMPQFGGRPSDCDSPIAGSFCTNGLPKQIYMQQRLIPNVAFVFAETSGKYRNVCEVRSLRDSTPWNSTSTLYLYTLAQNPRHIVAKVPYVVNKTGTDIEVPLHHCFLFLGVETREEMEAFLFPPHLHVAAELRNYLGSVISAFDFAATDPDAVRRTYATKMDKPLETVVSVFSYQFLCHCDYGKCLMPYKIFCVCVFAHVHVRVGLRRCAWVSVCAQSVLS